MSWARRNAMKEKEEKPIVVFDYVSGTRSGCTDSQREGMQAQYFELDVTVLWAVADAHDSYWRHSLSIFQTMSPSERHRRSTCNRMFLFQCFKSAYPTTYTGVTTDCPVNASSHRTLRPTLVLQQQTVLCQYSKCSHPVSNTSTAIDCLLR